MFRRERSRSDVFALEIAKKKHLSLLYKSSLHFTTVKEYEMTVFLRSGSGQKSTERRRPLTLVRMCTISAVFLKHDASDIVRLAPLMGARRGS